WADYPDEDIPEVEPDVLMSELEAVKADLSGLTADYDRGRIVRALPQHFQKVQSRSHRFLLHQAG
ncbi:MAG: hypothetical protein IJC21_05330, partial [Lentisphaeria bacterium]|nr:hypothetical protein [Lentisphaeria bacterium]